MLNRYLTYYKPAIQFIVFCAILSFSVLIGGKLYIILSEYYTGMSVEDFNALKEISPLMGDKIKKINAIALAVALLMPACVFSYLAYPDPFKYVGLTSKIKKHHWLWALTLLLIAIPFTSLLEEWSQLIPAIAGSKELDEQYNKMAKAMIGGITLMDLLSNTFFICIVPAFIEELLFRACLQNVLLSWMRKTPIAAILIVAVVFSAWHGQLSGFFPRMFLGTLLGLVYYFSGSIWLAIMMHAINNFMTILFVYLYNAKISTIDLTHLPNMNLFLGLASALAVTGLLYFFYQDRNPYEFIEVEKDESNI